MLQWVRNSEGRVVRISFPQGEYSESSLNLDQMGNGRANREWRGTIMHISP